MAQAIVVTLEKELPDAAAVYAKAGSGKALAREADRVDSAARRCKVTPPTSLLSESQAALILPGPTDHPRHPGGHQGKLVSNLRAVSRRRSGGDPESGPIKESSSG